MAKALTLDFRPDAILHFDLNRHQKRGWLGRRSPRPTVAVQIRNEDRSRELLLLLTEGEAESLLLLLLDVLPEVGDGNRSEMLSQVRAIVSAKEEEHGA